MEEAQAVVESQEKITMDGHTTLYIDYSSRFPKKRKTNCVQDYKIICVKIDKVTVPYFLRRANHFKCTYLLPLMEFFHR